LALALFGLRAAPTYSASAGFIRAVSDCSDLLTLDGSAAVARNAPDFSVTSLCLYVLSSFQRTGNVRRAALAAQRIRRPHRPATLTDFRGTF